MPVSAGRLVTQAFATRRLRRGELLNQTNIRLVASIAWDEPGGEQLVVAGWKVQRGLEQGAELRRPDVIPPMAVLRGRTVEIVWTQRSVDLSVTGKAAASAAVGEGVFVTTASGVRLRARVIAPGIVDTSDTMSLTSGGG